MSAERTVLVRLKAEVNDFQRGMVEAAAAVKGLTKEIDSSSDRTAWLAQGILALAPAAVTLGAGAVPAIAGITTQMTIGVAAAGTLALAFHGIGGALTALNNYQLQPTAAHLAAMQVAMQKVGPAGEQFVRFIDSVQPKLAALSATARTGMFPGMESGITHLLTLMPRFKGIVGELSAGLGQLANEAGKGLSGPKFRDFFTWLETNAKPILLDMGRTVGNVAEGLANMLVAFSGQSSSFSHGLLGMAQSFAAWSRTLDTNQSFQAFLDYTAQAGPKALDFIGSLIDAGSALIKAWAPVGQVMLPMLTDLLDVIAKIADTPIGPALLTVLSLGSAFGRLKAIGEISSVGLLKSFGGFTNGVVAQTKVLTSSFAKVEEGQKRVTYSAGQYGRALATTGIAVGAFALIASGQADSLGLTNTAGLTLAGTMLGPVGIALGATAGAFLDARSAAEDFRNTMDSVTVASEHASGAQLQQLKVQAQAAYDNRSAFSKATNALTDGVTAGFSALSGNGLHGINVDAQNLSSTLSILDGRLRMVGSHPSPGLHLLTQTLNISNHAAHLLVGGMQSVEKAFIHMSDILAGRAAMRDFQQAIDDATASLVKNGRTLDITTQKGRDNQAALDNIANTSIAVAEHLKGMDRQHFLVQSREDFVKAAVSLGRTKKGAEQLANQLGLLAKPHKVSVDNKKANSDLQDTTGKAKRLDGYNPKFMVGMDPSSKKKTTNDFTDLFQMIGQFGKAHPIAVIGANASPALREISFVTTALQNLPNHKTITITTVHSTGGSMKSGFDTGGYTGDGPKMEVRGVVHAGEVVVPKDLVQRDWAMLKARYGYLPGFAGGGLVSGAKPASSGPSKVMVSLDGMQVTGTLDTPWGPSSIRGIARSEAETVYHEQSAADRQYARRNS